MKKIKLNKSYIGAEIRGLRAKYNIDQEELSRKAEIDLYELMLGFEKIFTSMHKELLKALEPELQNVLNEINPYLQFTPEGKAKLCYIYEKETAKRVYSLTTFIGAFINKMCNPY